MKTGLKAKDFCLFWGVVAVLGLAAAAWLIYRFIRVTGLSEIPEGDLDAMLDGIVRDEAQLRAAAHLDPAAQLPPDKAGGAGEALDAFLGLLHAGHGADVYLAAGLVPRKVHLHNGQHGVDAGVLQFPEDSCQLPQDILAQPRVFKGCHGFSLFDQSLISWIS